MSFTENDIKSKLFENYINQLITETNFYVRKVKQNELNYKDIYTRVVYQIFKGYRDNLTSFSLDEYGKDRCFRKPTKDEQKEYECSENTEKTKFPLNRILEYRNEKFPEYIDDYGMQTFIEVLMPDETYKHIQTNETDWDYELDRIMDYERLIQLSAEDSYNLLLNDMWFRVE